MMGGPFMVYPLCSDGGCWMVSSPLWGWLLGFCVIAINLGADAINLYWRKTERCDWVLIAGLLLIYMARARVRNCFSRPS